MATEYHNGDLKRILERVAKAGDVQTGAAMGAVGQDMARATQGATHVVTGQLRSSIRATTPVRDGEGWTVGVTSSAFYAKFHPRLFKKATTAVKPRVVPLMKPLYRSWR